MFNAIISETAYCLPERVITNTELSEKYKESYYKKFSKKLTPELINKACGINERRYVTDSTRLRDMATKCIIDLLTKADLLIDDIDMIVLATVSPESLTPSNASLVLRELCKHYDKHGLKIGAYDINSACSGFLFGVEQAVNYIKLGQRKRVIVCGVEIMNRMLNGFDYHTGILFGDGAAAVLVEQAFNTNSFGVNKTKTECVTDHIDDITYYSSLSSDFDKRIQLNGSKVYRNGTALTIEFTERYLSENNLNLSDFDYFIFHQSNVRMLNEIAFKLKVPLEKMLINVDTVGNTASASIPLCLAQYNEKGTFKNGDRILLCSFGAGYSLAIVDFNWSIKA